MRIYTAQDAVNANAGMYPGRTPEEAAAVNAVIAPQAAAWADTMNSWTGTMARANAEAQVLSEAANRLICAKNDYAQCGPGGACQPGGTADPMYVNANFDQLGVKCTYGPGNVRWWPRTSTPQALAAEHPAHSAADTAREHAIAYGLAPRAPGEILPGEMRNIPLGPTTATYMPMSASVPPASAPAGFQPSATPGRNYAGYPTPATVAAATASGSNPVSTAGGVVGGMPPAESGISPVMLALAAAAAFFIFKGGK